ncbi:dihydrofolate reductase [Mucilaginibacter auburnensis]|uniref:Dihydrofolate reductase n=1 Tax=Mucilaginibacter auburnensis TaxID=1457233 RepID=A0A2H9VMP3_9SPHI|nr:dihydrofolate reductase [Mucilaginibacter auburnensis]PJJ79602.1 dihydrofolate reductase [Mucilaginibacter auburnensis]
MTITIVVAIAQNHAIGKDNKLLWHLPNDLKHFKNITTGGTVIMGRKTYDSVGKPLPNRRNIIITRQKINIEGCEVVNSLDEAVDLCKTEQEVFIVGGAEIYKMAMPVTDRIYLTIVHHDFDADTYFPEIEGNNWTETEREDHQSDEKHKYAYSFITLERR